MQGKATTKKVMTAMTVDHSDPEANLGLRDFSDPRVFAVSASYSDRNSALACGPDSFIDHQPHDGPAYIVVGSAVPDERLMRNLVKLNERYGVTLRQLQDARGGALVRVR